MPLLNTADKVYLGSSLASAVYLGATKVWPPAAPSGFDPSTLTGLAVWFDAKDYTSGSWPNKAAGGVAPTFVDTPLPKVSTNTQNGLPLVRFTVSEGRARIQSGTGVNLDWTLVYVARMVGPYTTGRIVDAVYPPNNLLVGFWNGFQDVCYDAGFTSPNTQVSVTSDWKMYSGDGAPGLTRFFSDGALLGSTTTSAGWGGTFAMSGYDAANTSESCDCEIAEVLQYNRKLSDAERAQVEGYLHDKWFVAHGPVYDVDTQAYLTATGLSGTTYGAALDALVVGLKSNGLWSKMNAIYPMIGGTPELHRWNLKDPRDLDAAYRLTFTGGTHSTALGYRPNAQGAVSSGGYADTHCIPLGTLAQDSTHLAYYSLADVPAISRCEMGCYTWGAAGSGARFHIIARYQPSEFYYGMSENGFTNVTVPASSGLFVATRTASDTQTAYRNGVSLATSTAASIALPPQSIWVGGINTFVDRSDLPCGFASIGSGLTDRNVTDLYNVVQTFQTTLNRQV